MTIQEAIQSGNRFRRNQRNSVWYELDINNKDQLSFPAFKAEDILATDWEVEEEKIEITRSNLLRAFQDAYFRISDDRYSLHEERLFLQRLGFKV